MRKAGLLLTCLLCAAVGFAEERGVVEIPAQPLSAALNELAAKSGLQLAYLPDVTEGLDSPGTNGSVAPRVALRQLLAGSGLEYEFINAETVVIRRRPPPRTPVEEQADTTSDVATVNGTVRRVAGPRARDRPLLEELIVTGSRIERSGRVTPTPTTVISGESLRLAGVTRVADYLVELPAIGATHTAANSNDNPSESGAGLLDLRRLGIERTLVLVNGRRHVGSRPGTSAIDVNTIPASLIERVEIITGGASAVYGADAVSGVVNIILKQDIDGLELHLQTGRSARGDGSTVAASLTAGGKFHEDRGRVYIDLSYDDTGKVDAIDRDHARRAPRFVPNPGPGADNRLLEGTRFNGTPPGGLPVIDTSGTPLPGGPYTFDTGGNLVTYDSGAIVPGAPFLSVGGDGIFLAPFDRLQVPLERQIISGGFDYAPGGNATLFADGKHARVLSRTAGQPGFSLTTFVPLTIAADNAYIRPDLATVLAGDVNDPADDIQRFFLPRTHVDLGRRRARSERDTTQVLLGLRGGLAERWRYELAWQHGRTTNVTELQDNPVNLRLQQAADAVFDASGRIVCRDPSGGCAPVNLLGQGLISAAGRDFVLADVVTRGTLEQSIASATLAGTVTRLPAGPLGVALGLEYREESSRTEEGELRNQGEVFPGGRIEDVAGRFDVTEAFGEVVVPLLAGRRFIEASSIEAAVRVADYSTIGRTTTWRLGGDWLPVEGLRLRGMLARAVRAPNIGELFSPARLENLFLNDPCDQARLDNGSANRRANCAALGLPPDFQSTAGAITTRVFSGGNPALTEEAAETVTAGLVVTPPGSGIGFTADWWDIEINNAVNSFPVQSTLNNCVDLPTTNNPFCPSIVRDSAGQFVSVNSSLINVAAQRASGLDVELMYSLPLQRVSARLRGSLQLNALATYLDKLAFQPLPDVPDTDREAGELGDPRIAANVRLTWQYRDMAVTIGHRLLGNQRFERSENAGVRDPDSTGSVSYTDLSLRYRWRDRYRFHAGVRNLSDRAPPPIARIPEVRSFGDDAGLYDVVGRYLFAGITATLP